MCVIIVKDKLGKLPTKESLENCFTRNGDGAGFMYTDKDGKVVIDKGYMKFKNFYKHYQKLCKIYNNFEGKNLVMHMRISTSGGTNVSNTHPFEITDNYEDMKKTYKKCELGLAHNGIISATHPSKEEETQGINDTMVFIKTYVNPIYREWKECFKNASYLAGIKQITNSKFAILKENDELYMVGDFQKYDGAYYSNDSYSGYKYYGSYYNGKTYTKYYDWYDYYDDYGYEDAYYMNKYAEYSKKAQEKQEEELKEEEKNLDYYEDYDTIELENDDLIAFNDEYEPLSIEELRTANNTKFFYHLDDFILEEITSSGIVINTYYNCYLMADVDEKIEK